MADADWDKDEFKAPTVATGRSDRWEGEDEEDVIKDNWDDEDEEETKSEGTDQPKPVPEKKKKKTFEMIVAEKEEKRRKELEEKKKLLEEQANSSKPKTQEELLQERLEQQKLQEESDLLLAKEAFGVTESKSDAFSLDFPLSSKEDFDNFKKNLVTKLQAVEKSPHYVSFLETAFREVCVTLEADDIKRISSNLNALFNEKIKAQKQQAAKGKKNKPKTSIKIERSDMDFAGDDYGDEFDEFI